MPLISVLDSPTARSCSGSGFEFSWGGKVQPCPGTPAVAPTRDKQQFLQTPWVRASPSSSEGVCLPSQPPPGSGRDPPTGRPQAANLMTAAGLKQMLSSPLQHHCPSSAEAESLLWGLRGHGRDKQVPRVCVDLDKPSSCPDAQAARL